MKEIPRANGLVAVKEFDFHSYSSLILFSRHSSGRQHCLQCPGLCQARQRVILLSAGPDPDVQITYGRMYSTIEEVRTTQAATVNREHIAGQTDSRILAWRTELLFDKVCMRRFRELCELMNSTQAEYKRKECMARLNCFPTTEQKAE